MNPSFKEPDPSAHNVSAGDDHWEGHMSDGVGSTFGPEPLAFLNATPHEILLSGNRGTFRLPRQSIQKIGRGRLYPWVFAGVSIRHNLAGVPAELQFRPMKGRSRDVIERLRALGYPV